MVSKICVRAYFLSVIEMIIGCSFYDILGAFNCITVGYTVTDTQNVIPTTLEE